MIPKGGVFFSAKNSIQKSIQGSDKVHFSSNSFKQTFIFFNILILLTLLLPITNVFAGSTDLRSYLTFSIENMDKEIDLSSIDDVTHNDVTQALTDIMSKEGKYYYLENEYMYANKEDSETVGKVYLSYKYDESEIMDMDKEIDDEINRIISLTEGQPDAEKVKIIYDYFLDNFTYSENSSDIYDLFTQKKGSCCALSLGFKEVLNRLDIPVRIIVNKSLTHEWTQVYIDNQWSNIELTWGISLNARDVRYRYLAFLVPDYILRNKGYEF